MTVLVLEERQIGFNIAPLQAFEADGVDPIQNPSLACVVYCDGVKRGSNSIG